MKKSLLTLLILLLSLNSLLAQVPPPPDNQENFTTPGGPSGPVPVDQYVFILIGIALSIGAYLVWNKQKAFN